MNLKERIELYKEIEKLRGNPLIVYVTSQRSGASGQMAGDVIDEFIDQIELLDNDLPAVDLLIESTGGDGLTAWRIITLLRAKAKKVNILIPHSAFSAATILALGADEVVMGRYGSLGPIDPQITVKNKDGSEKKFAYEDIVAFIDFTKKEFGLTEQKNFESAFRILCETVEPSALGFATRASSLAVSIGERLLQMHLTDPDKKSQAASIAKKLNKSFFSHGHALSKTEAKDIGLNIVDPSADIEKLMWNVHSSFEKQLQTRKPFDVIAEFLSEPAASPYLVSPTPLNLPPQIPQDLAMQLMQTEIVKQLAVATPDVRRDIKTAFLESARAASESRAKIKILLTRNVNMSFAANAVVLEQGWVSLDIHKK